MNKLLIGVVILLIVVAGMFLILNSDSSDNDSEDLNTNVDGTLSDTGDDEVKTFIIDGANFKFKINGVENPDIKVNEGDKVRIEFTSLEGFHNFVIDEFNAKTEKVNAPELSSIEFVANKKGTFEYYCSVGQHRANGMKGRFVVE